MSSVLDALKKAEGERREAASPLILSAAASRARPVRKFQPDFKAIFWLALIIANLALGAWLLLASPLSGGSVSTAKEPASTPHVADRELTTDAHLPSPEATPLLPPAEAATQVEVAERETNANAGLSPIEFELPSAPISQNTAVTIEPRVTATEQQGSAGSSATDSGTVVERPDEGPLRPYQGNDFKTNKLGAHIFSDVPARRMVMLDGTAFREQAQLANGWKLLEIGREQLVVERDNQRYSVLLSDLR